MEDVGTLLEAQTEQACKCQTCARRVWGASSRRPDVDGILETDVDELSDATSSDSGLFSPFRLGLQSHPQLSSVRQARRLHSDELVG